LKALLLPRGRGLAARAVLAVDHAVVRCWRYARVGAQRGGAEQEATGAEQADWCRLSRFPKVLQVAVDVAAAKGVDSLLQSVMEADFARAHALVRGTTGKDALELRAALERARAALEAGATVQDALAEMDEAPTARNDAQSTLAGPSSGQTGAVEELVTVLESTFRPELFDPYCTPAALGPGGKSLHDRLAAFCRKPWFERLFIAVLVAFCVINFPFLCGVPGPFSALTWTTWLLFLAIITVMYLICSLR
jgi:hypothetical protein